MMSKEKTEREPDEVGEDALDMGPRCHVPKRKTFSMTTRMRKMNLLVHDAGRGGRRRESRGVARRRSTPRPASRRATMKRLRHAAARAAWRR